MLTARYFSQLPNKSGKGIFISTCFLLAMSVLIDYVLYTFLQQTNVPDPASAKLYLGIAATVLTAGSLLCCYCSLRRLDSIFIYTTFTSSLFLLAVMAAMPAIDTRSILPLANAIKQMQAPGDEVVAYNQYYQDLPFYLGQQVSIVDWKNELDYGMQHQNTTKWMYDEKTFWRHFRSKRRLFAIMSREELKSTVKKYPRVRIYVLKRTASNALISNKRANP